MPHSDTYSKNNSFAAVFAVHPAETSEKQVQGATGDISTLEKALDPTGEQKPPRNVHGFAWVVVVLSILTTTFLFGLDNTIVADVQPAIVERFESISKLPWLSVAFLVGAASTNLIWSATSSSSNAQSILRIFSHECTGARCILSSTPKYCIF